VQNPAAAAAAAAAGLRVAAVQPPPSGRRATGAATAAADLVPSQVFASGPGTACPPFRLSCGLAYFSSGPAVGNLAALLEKDDFDLPSESPVAGASTRPLFSST